MDDNIGWAVPKYVKDMMEIQKSFVFDVSKTFNTMPSIVQSSNKVRAALLGFKPFVEQLEHTGQNLIASMNTNLTETAFTLNESVRTALTGFESINTGLFNDIQNITKHLNTQFDVLEKMKIVVPEYILPSIPKDLVKNIEYLSRAALSSPVNYDGFIDDEESVLEYEQMENELIQELESNPKKIWKTINEWAAVLMNFPSKIRQKQPAIYFLIWFTCSLISFTGIYLQLDITINKAIHESSTIEVNKPKQNVNIIKANLGEEYGIEGSIINQVRVTTRDIPVFQSNRTKSNRVDTIQKNKPVVILEKRRNWSYITYSTEDSVEATGWVMTRFLLR